MRRQLGTTVVRGSYTCLPTFSSPTPQVTLRHGCGSTASVTRTRRVSTAGALQSWVFFIASFVRGVVGLHPQCHLVDACTCSSCGCRVVYQLAVLRFWLVVSGSQVSLHVGSRRGHTFGTRSEFCTRG